MNYAFTASGDIEQGAVVKLVGDFTVSAAAAAADKAIGVALESATDGENVLIKTFGDIIHGYAGGTIAAGDPVVPTTNGDVITTTTAGDVARLIALEAASSGEEIRMMVQTITV